MDPENSEVMKQVNFSEVTHLLQSIKAGKTPSSKVDVWRKYVKKFQERFKDQSFSFFPFIRLLLPKIDRERESYGIQVATMGQFYIDSFGFSSSSREAKSLTTQKGFNSNTSDYADVVFNVIKDRCPRKCSLSVWEMNELLDKIADPKTSRSDMKIFFLQIIQSTTAQDQRWIVRIILKRLHLGIAERSILGVYHPRAFVLFERMTYLSRVCELVDSGKADDAEDDDVVSLFQPLRCMLCEPVKLERLPQMLRTQDLFVELKMDGERFQIHKEGSSFRYFSRNNEYTEKFGAQATGKTFSASLDRKLDPSIRSVILDGEMLVWDQEEGRFLAKGDGLDARNLNPGDQNRLQVFCAFDILFLNGESLIRKPYMERVRLLEKMIKVEETVVIICQRKRVETIEEILEFFNAAIDKNEEGIILKGQDSVYKPGMRNNSGWFKLKPDYVNGLISDLDLLIIGATRNRRGFIESFIMGVGIKEVEDGRGDPEENMTFHSLSMVRSGLTFQQWRSLNATLSPHWMKNEDWPVYLEFGNARPQCWIEPKNSVILQVKATELNKTNAFKTEYTLRFPRISAVRSDKPWHDCCLLSEFQNLVGDGGRVQKIAKRHAQLSDVTAAASKRAKGRKLALENIPRPIFFDDELEVLDRVCEKLEFCILSTKKGQPSVRELGNFIKRHDGIVVANPGPKTFLCVAGDLIINVTSYAKTKLYDIVKVEWLVRALGGNVPLERLPPLKPFHMISVRQETREKFEKEFDRFNDSFVLPIEENVELKEICDAMPEPPCYERLLEREVVAFEEEHLGEEEEEEYEKVNLFSSISGYFYGNHSEHVEMVFRSRRGIIVEHLSEASHVFVGQVEEGDEEDFLLKLPKNVKLLTNDFIFESIRQGRRVEEEDRFEVIL